MSSNTERETMPTPTPADIADLLHAAHDEMMIRGRCTGSLIKSGGEVCLEGAIAVACGLSIRPSDTQMDRIHNSRVTWDSMPYLMAKASMAARGFNFIWNDKIDRTDDDVLDAFLNTEKELREQFG